MKSKLQPNGRKLKTFLPLFLFLIIFSSIALASYTDEWGEYQNDETNRGFVHDESGTWEGLSIVDTQTIGNLFQPLAIDWDNDSSIEVIVFETTFASVLDSSLDVEGTLNLVKTPLSQPTFYTNNSIDYLAIIVSAELRIYSYNGSTIALNKTIAINTTEGRATGIKYAHGFLYFATSINSSSSNFYKIRTLDLTIINATTKTGNYTHNPAIADIDFDAVDEIVFVCDVDNNGQFGLCVFDGDLGNYDVGFSTDGIIDDLHTKGDSSYINSPITWNVDGTTDVEIIISYIKDGTCSIIGQYIPVITSYNSDGSIDWTNIGSNPSIDFPDCDFNNYATYISQPFIVSSDGQSSNLVCFYNDGTETSTSNKKIGCLNVIDGSLNWSAITYPKTLHPIQKGVTSGGAFQKTENNDYIVFGQFVYLANGTFKTNITQVDGNYEYAFVDVNGDTNLDLIYTSSSTTKVAYSNFTDAVPSFNNLRVNTGNPVCQHEFVTFSSLEGSSDYTNDNDENKERLVVQLPNGTQYNSTYSGSSPSVQVPFNTTGTFNLVVYLQDEPNSADLSQSLNYLITISSNTAVCNEAGISGTSTTTEDASADDITESFFDAFGLTTTSDKAKALIWVVVALWLAVVCAGGIEVILIAEVVWIVAGILLGMIPLWIPIFLGFIGIAFIVYSIFSGSNGGG